MEQALPPWPNGARIAVLLTVMYESWPEGKGPPYGPMASSLKEGTLDLARAQYEIGVGTQLDLLQAQDAVQTSLVALAQAHFDVAAADLALRHAAGTFPPK